MTLPGLGLPPARKAGQNPAPVKTGYIEKHGRPERSYYAAPETNQARRKEAI